MYVSITKSAITLAQWRIYDLQGSGVGSGAKVSGTKPFCTLTPKF